MSYNKCPFCEMGQAKRMIIWRFTRDLSRKELSNLIKKNKKDHPYICYKCGKNCGNAGMLAMHMKSPARAYKHLHKKYDEEEHEK